MSTRATARDQFPPPPGVKHVDGHLVVNTSAASQVLVATGPMFSGKTSALLDYLERCRALKLRVLAVKPAIDQRYGAGEIITHSGERMPCRQVSALAEVDATDYDVIGIDEGQFLPDLPDFCDNLLRQHRGKTAVVSMLRGDFRAQPWDSTSRLVALATDVVVLKADCDVCGAAGEAAYTARRAADNKSKIEVGGAEKYFAACAECYFLEPTLNLGCL